MNEVWIDEAEEFLQVLASVAARIDPVPSAVVEAAIGCYKWRSIDAELAELLFDSERTDDLLVGVRSQAGTRQLTFEAHNLVVELEVDLRARPQLVGQLVPPGPADVEIRSPGDSFLVKADEFGRFWADTITAGHLSLHIVSIGRDGQSADTPWVSITPTSDMGDD